MKKFIVKNVKKETADVNTIFFSCVDNEKLLFCPGQCITVQFSSDQTNCGKAYSLSNATSEQNYSLSVKSIGEYSKKICQLSPGDEFFGSIPYGYLFEDIGSPIVCFAAGIGVSPIWSIIKSILETNPGRRIDLFYSNKTTQDIVFFETIESLSLSIENFNVSYFITREKNINSGKFISGRIDFKAISRAFEDSSNEYIICGCQSFVTSIYHNLVDIDISENQIHTEAFY